MRIAGLLAGGTGTRMGILVPKQFVEIGGIPVIVRTIKAFKEANVDKIIVAMNADWIGYFTEILYRYDLYNEVTIIVGGDTRFESMCNLVKAADAINADKIIIHDVARPFITTDIINNNFLALDEYPCTTTAIPAIDTIIESKDGLTETSVPDRNFLWNDQGPQAFKVKEFLALCESTDCTGFMEAGRLYRTNNLPVYIVNGCRENFKITNKIDLIIAEAILCNKN